MIAAPLFGSVLIAAALLAAQPGPESSTSPAPPPTAAPTPTYNYVYRATPSPVTTPFPGAKAPEIDEIDINDSTIVTPGALHVRVLTSEAVATVTAETMGRSIPIPQRQPGLFAFDGYIPSIPAFLRNRRYDVDFVAAASDGRSAHVTLPLGLK